MVQLSGDYRAVEPPVGRSLNRKAGDFPGWVVVISSGSDSSLTLGVSSESKHRIMTTKAEGVGDSSGNLSFSG